MAIRVNPALIDELTLYGAEDVQKCYHCGSCSAVCNHSDDAFVFPRRPVRLLQMGLEKRIKSSLDPWLCYYCGQCSTQCPRGAEPGETMMSLRRWLTSRYDFTGLSRLFYRSWKAELFVLAAVSLLTGIGFVAFALHAGGDIHVYDGERAFLPAAAVHVFDWGMAAVLTTFVVLNALRMWWFTTAGNERIRAPFWSYLKNLPSLPLHFFTQKRYARCDSRMPWLIHLVLMLSYVTMFVLIMGFLRLVQAGPEIDWSVHAFGYLASAGLLFTVTFAVRNRQTKSTVQSEHSHESDWVFLGMLLAVTATGVVQHVLHRSGFDLFANLAYVMHMMLVVPMLTVEVPFSKWSHMIYRPLAMYLAEVHRDSLAASATPAKPASVAARAA